MRQKALRIALVCYGGVSLAIYMHGVTRELWQLARASRDFHAGKPARDGVEAVYRALIDRIAEEQDLRLRVLPDIMSGASAGGINAVFLAQAVHSGQSLEPLTDLWREVADVDELVDPAARLKWRFSKLWAQPFANWLLSRPGSDIANAVGKDRSTVANLLRLLKLPPSIRKLVEDESLSMGHARALLSVVDPLRAADLARAAVKGGWSVREVEKRARSADSKGRSKRATVADPLVRELEVALRDSLATLVLIKQKRGGKGSIEIQYHGAEDFERVFALITRREVSEGVE